MHVVFCIADIDFIIIIIILKIVCGVVGCYAFIVLYAPNKTCRFDRVATIG